jgi:sulfide:quinone oxidoreductase
MEIKKISPFLSVSPQIETGHVRQIAAQGFRTIINNRPDKEKDNQPLASDLSAEAVSQGMVFINQPVISSNVTIGDSERFAAELHLAEGPVLAFCRSGTRCTILWALSEARHREVDVIMRFASSIGYDLKKYRENLEQIAAFHRLASN